MDEHWFERGPGRDLADYTGLPLNDDARAIALSYTPSVLAMPAACERYCCGWLGFEGLPRSALGLSCIVGGTGTLSIPAPPNDSRSRRK
jgi:hypothetical protein